MIHFKRFSFSIINVGKNFKINLKITHLFTRCFALLGSFVTCDRLKFIYYFFKIEELKSCHCDHLKMSLKEAHWRQVFPR